jgi:hypothetical protein
MKTNFPPAKILSLILGLILQLTLTTCDPNKNDDTQSEEHCKSTTLVTKMLSMTIQTYQYTYYCESQGDYVLLGYFLDDNPNICPTKPIHLYFYADLSMNQSRPVNVIAKVTWGHEFNSVELPIEKTILDGSYIYKYKGDLDLSAYYLDGGPAEISLKVYFKFVSSGVNLTDQNYLKSIFDNYTFLAEYYPY